MERGWVKVWRKLEDNPYMSRPYFAALWLHLLLLATHKEIDAVFGTERIRLKPGELITGRNSLSKRTGIKPSTLEDILKTLEKQHQIRQQTTTKNRLITIVNWECYQSDRQQSRQQADNKPTTKRHIQEQKNVKNVEEVTTNTASATPNAGVQEVLKEFYKINPAIQFGSPPQRKAATELLSRLGAEKLLPVIASLAASNLDRYAPKIYTPVELRNKWSALVDFWKRKEQDKPKPKTVDITNR